MLEHIAKTVCLAAGGVGSLVLASGAVVPADGEHSAEQWYWIAEKFGLLGLMLFGLALGAWFILPKAIKYLFEHLQKLEDRNEKSRQDFLAELREERTHRETTIQGFKDHLETHSRETTDAIRIQTETLVKALKQ